MPPQRPTAFDVSFPQEAAAAALEEQEAERSRAQAAKRKVASDALNALPPRARKRSRNLHHIKSCNYVAKPNEIKETAGLILDGEASEAQGLEDDDDYETVRLDGKPVRVLSSFAFFDPRDNLGMVPLSVLGGIDSNGEEHLVEGAGFVVPLLLNEEDAGQVEDLVNVRDQEYIRLTQVIRHFIDYSKIGDPITVETSHAFYQLRLPSPNYKPFFRVFYTPHRIAQLVILKATTHPNQNYDSFLKDFLAIRDNLLQKKISEDDLEDAIPNIKIAVDECDDIEKPIKVPFLKYLLRYASPQVAAEDRQRRQAPRRRLNDIYLASSKNVDLQVLRPENQTRTHITPLIARLAKEYFPDFSVVGPPDPPSKKSVKEKKEALQTLRKFINNSFARRSISFRREQRLGHRSNWLRSVLIGEEQYDVGDVVVMPIGQYGSRKAPVLPQPERIPDDATIEDYFWFARIIYISEEHETAHVQWFWHSSTTAIGELSDRQELFLSELCDTVELQAIAGKVEVHFYDPASRPPAIKAKDFFYRFSYDSFLATYTDIDRERIANAKERSPPNNCSVCDLVQQKERESHAQRLQTGIAYLGMNFHMHDFVLIRADDGPCKIGHITRIEFPGRWERRRVSPTIIVKLLGRISQLKGIMPQYMVKDERHLFLTDVEERVRLEDLIRVCYVFPLESIHKDDFDLWISFSPDHFYAKYLFPSMNIRSWAERRLVHQEIDVCVECCRESVAKFESMKAFVPFAKREPLRALDLFGGVGGLGLGMAECGFLQVTHAIEISPSAAKTYKRNSPETIVYNNCANKVLQYAIKRHERHYCERPVNLHDKTLLPDPPVPNDVEVILAGFPWRVQSHSSLNMFRKADDPKNGLILTTLSWIDFMRPRICVLENVRGFLQFNLAATQLSKYRVEGGIEMGGLKLVLHALISMNYQIRFGLLQAAHYGIPQTRVRFFLIAAKSGYPLPELPQPYCDFPVVDGLAIKLPVGDTIRPIRTANGTAPHPFVTVEDAIGDLPRFDWKNPRPDRELNEKQHEALERERDIPAIVCNKKSPYCGYQGAEQYQWHYQEPKTTYQSRSRKRDTTDLQHYTRILLPPKVESVCNIPLKPGADYRNMRRDLHKWPLVNPHSAVAKGGFKPGWYGRLDKDGWFSTTVTNVDPMAKQSKVLHPYCKRIVSVRELARSQGFPDHFVFESVNDNVVTLHRQIGNAVPWLVSVAIGKEIQMTLFNIWLKEKGPG